MPNWFTRGVERVGQVLGRMVGREPEVSRQPTGPLPGERRGLGERLRDIIQPGRADRERLERELAEARDRERQEREGREQAERAAAEARAIAQQEREARQQAEREAREKTEPRQAVRPQPAAPQLPAELQGIPAVMPLGPKGRDGAAYTTASSGDVMARLNEAASLGKRVSLRVHDENGWHDLFLNPDGPGRHKAARGIDAGYLRDQIGGDFDAWVDEGCDTDEGGGYEDELGEADGYQLTVWG